MTGDVVPATDRGLAYGDGVFRTLAVRGGRIRHWDRQYAKLQADCARLSIACPDAHDLRDDVAACTAHCDDAAVKIIVTRGSGARGYRLPSRPAPNRVVIASPFPAYPPAHVAEGVDVHVCRIRLSAQPALAGIKHLNRLENVLARAEWDGDECAEGLMLDERGSVIGGTMTNLFIVEGGALVTPDVSRCGVAGVTRELVLERAAASRMATATADLPLERVMNADEILLVNSLIGAWRVRAVAGQATRERGVTARIREWLDESGANR